MLTEKCSWEQGCPKMCQRSKHKKRNVQGDHNVNSQFKLIIKICFGQGCCYRRAIFSVITRNSDTVLGWPLNNLSVHFICALKFLAFFSIFGEFKVNTSSGNSCQNICSQWAYSCDQRDRLPNGPHHTHGGCKNKRLAQRSKSTIAKRLSSSQPRQEHEALQP